MRGKAPAAGKGRVRMCFGLQSSFSFSFTFWPHHSPHPFYLSCNPAFSLTFLSFHHFLSGFLGHLRGLGGAGPGSNHVHVAAQQSPAAPGLRNVHLFLLAPHIPAFIRATFILHFLTPPPKRSLQPSEGAVSHHDSNFQLSQDFFSSLEFLTLSAQMPSSGQFNKPINVSLNDLETFARKPSSPPK